MGFELICANMSPFTLLPMILVLAFVVGISPFEVEPWYKDLAHFGPLDRDHDAGEKFSTVPSLFQQVVYTAS